MPYTPPTADNFRERFPEFDDVDDTVVEASLAEAGRYVDTSWTEGDYAIAIRLLAAHFLQAGINEASSSSSSETETISVGPITIRSGGSQSKSLYDFSSTSYGQRFKELQSVNVGGPLVI
jgi:hypothetical protein